MDFVYRRQSEQIDNIDNNNNNHIPDEDEYFREWSSLRAEFQNLELEHFYNTYVKRLQKSYLSLFFIIHTVIGIGHSLIILLTNPFAAEIPDVYVYVIGVILVWSSLFTVFRENLVKKYQFLPYVVSCFALFSLILIDLSIPLYHSVVTYVTPALRPCYGTYILFVIYIFLPLSEHSHAIILGLCVTTCYLIELSLVTYRLDENRLIRIITEGIYYLCVNTIGIYFRMMNEIAIRRTFLDRRKCVQGNLMLKFARDQQKDLLLSVLPEHTAEKLEKDIREVITKIKKEKENSMQAAKLKNTDISIPKKQFRGGAINKYYVEEHSDVTVLYADVVNYTFMTTQLPVEALVETLHELFVKFDQASQEHNVLRIKFLGDCYYCVSGVPEKNMYHAKSCVDLGLRMIRDIKEVRIQRNLNIDMRIGIHSGKIIAGVIGACKWQYDIWSTDVDIANRMESTGVPGRVHVTRQTLELLDNEYDYECGTEKAKEDPILKKHNIQTFLIATQQFYFENNFISPEDTGNRRMSKVKFLIKKNTNRKSRLSEPLSTRRNFMQNSMMQYMQIMKKTNEEMSRELQRMPIGKLQLNALLSTKIKERRMTEDDIEKKNLANISSVFLLFPNRSYELKYLKESDLLLKYTVMMASIIFISICLIQILNRETSWIFWVIAVTSAILLFVGLILCWFNKLWNLLMPTISEDSKVVAPPKLKFLNNIYQLSFGLTRNFLARTVIFLLTISTLTVCSFVNLIYCPEEPIPLGSTFFLCTSAWGLTQCIVLTVCMCFLFLKIYFLLKFLMGAIIVSLYGWVVFKKISYLFVNSPTFNPGISSDYSHFLTVLVVLIIFHLIDRQTEYISRIDYNWKQQLLKKQKDTEFTKETNEILVQNILPAHVADIYLNSQLKDKLYYEKYENVAVMFATITNYNTDTDSLENSVLSVLNQIICDFDDKLLSHNAGIKIEKIKVAGWTYMVACGLEPGRENSSSSSGPGSIGYRTSIGANGRRSLNTTVNKESIAESGNATTVINRNKGSVAKSKFNQRFSSNVVCIMTEFALELMQVLRNNTDENFKTENPGLLRVGIAHGEVMAGVIGSSKPLYDIWGNAVNMSSRMESTGIPGMIQVTLETAMQLKSFGIECKYRGETMVKGRGKIPTYFVCVDNNLQFIRTLDTELTDSYDTYL